jgi:hypothetical protein
MARCTAAIFLVPVLVGALGAGGCKEERGDEDGSAKPAGQVVELTGSVKAAREGAAARELGRGDAIYRDDTVTTAADGSVTILLAHNQARWSLTGGRERRVDRSPAWRAEPGSGSGSAFDDEEKLPTSSAGRHSEPQVGDTRATAQQPGAAPAATEAAADETRMAEREAPARKAGSSKRRERAPREPEVRAKGQVAAEPEGAVGGGLALGAVPAPAPPPAGGGAGSGSAGEADESVRKRGVPMQVSESKRAALASLRVTGARKRAELTGALEGLGQGAQLCALGASQGGVVVVSFDIGRKGDVARVRLKGPRALVAEVGECLRKKAGELTFARRREGTTRVRQTIRFEVP